MTSNTYGLRLLRQPPVRFAVLALLAVLVLAYRALQFVAFANQIEWGYDFSAYWAAARHLIAGEPIYTATQLAGSYAPQVHELYLYPPPLAALVMPLAWLFPTDYRAAAWVWAAVGAAILVWSVLSVTRSEGIDECYPVLHGRRRWLLVAAAFAFPPVIGELVLGNVHLLLLGLLTLAWLGLRRAEAGGEPGRVRGELVAGIAAGVATVVKIFPGVLLLWFLLARRFRAAVGVVIGAAVLVLVTLSFTGIEPWTQYPTVLANLSAPSDTTDTLAPTVWLAPILGFTVARVLVTAVGLAIIAWAAVRSSIGTARSFAIAVTVSILIAPALYQHYLALLVLPFLLAFGARVPLRYLAIAYFLMWGGDQPALGDLSWVVNRVLPTAGSLVLLGALALTRADPPRPWTAPSPEPDPAHR
jgi:hypothetical protein